MSTHEPAGRGVCAWCDGPLPAPGKRLAVVRPSDGATMLTCSATCMAELLRQGTDGLHRRGSPSPGG